MVSHGGYSCLGRRVPGGRMPKGLIAARSRRPSSPCSPPHAAGRTRTATRSPSGPRRTSPTGWPSSNRSSPTFTQQTGIKVDLVGVAEDQFSQLITSAAAAGRAARRDRGASRSPRSELEANDLLDTETAGRVVDRLGRGHVLAARAGARPRTAASRCRARATPGRSCILYRKDLFAAGRAAPRPTPTTRLQAAAAKLNTRRRSPASRWPPRRATPSPRRPSSTSRSPTAASWSDGAGKVTLDSPACVRAFAFYADLARNYSVPGHPGPSTPPGPPTSPARPPW